ncbi:MAG: winged helix-turn-helix domain-containing protein [Methanobacteriota archaeon]
MINIYEEIGRHAGEIWRTLNTYGPLPETKLMDTARLNEDEFYAAVGWLARENKICKTGALFRLGETNLTNKIGADAGKIWKVLEVRGTFDVSDISVLTQIDERDAYSALGWLARENKIEAKTSLPKQFKPKHP